MKHIPLPDVDLLRECFNYDKDTGIVTLLKQTSQRTPLGYEVGSLGISGYLGVCFQGKHYRLARVIWKLVTGDDPLGQIDHINRIRTDNRWVNLRVVTQQQNNLNRGVKGYYLRPSGRYAAVLQGKNIGTFETPEEASQVYELAREKVLNDSLRNRL
jgi:hypothetical protein